MLVASPQVIENSGIEARPYCSLEEDRSTCKAMWVRLCETLPKTDGYDFMRLDSSVIHTYISADRTSCNLPFASVCYTAEELGLLRRKLC